MVSVLAVCKEVLKKAADYKAAFLSITFALVLIFSFSSISQAQQSEARQWLDKMSRSLKESTYQGVLSYQRGDQQRSLKIMHGVIDGEEYERLISLEGEPFEVIKHGHDLSCVHVGERQLRLDQKAGAAHIHNQPDIELSADIESCYELSLMPGTRVAGRETMKLVFEPKDTHRYRRVMLLDAETGMLLQNTIYNPQRVALEQYRFLSLDFSPIPESELKFDHSEHQHMRLVDHPKHHPQRDTQSQLKWAAEWLPKGYQATPDMMSIRSTDENSLSIAMYSDGVSTFTIFIENNSKQLTGLGRMQKGATSVVARAVSVTDSNDNLLVTVAGEIPLQTATRIAEAVTF